MNNGIEINGFLQRTSSLACQVAHVCFLNTAGWIWQLVGIGWVLGLTEKDASSPYRNKTIQ